MHVRNQDWKCNHEQREQVSISFRGLAVGPSKSVPLSHSFSRTLTWMTYVSNCVKCMQSYVIKLRFALNNSSRSCNCLENQEYWLPFFSCSPQKSLIFLLIFLFNVPPLILKTAEAHSQRSHFALPNFTIHIVLVNQGWRITMVSIPRAPCFFLPSPLALGEKSISMLQFPDAPTD